GILWTIPAGSDNFPERLPHFEIRIRLTFSPVYSCDYDTIVFSPETSAFKDRRRAPYRSQPRSDNLLWPGKRMKMTVRLIGMLLVCVPAFPLWAEEGQKPPAEEKGTDFFEAKI